MTHCRLRGGHDCPAAAIIDAPRSLVFGGLPRATATSIKNGAAGWESLLQQRLFDGSGMHKLILQGPPARPNNTAQLIVEHFVHLRD